MAVDRVEASYRRNHPRLWHALLAYSGDPDVASDAEAEAFTQAIRRGDALTDVDAWVWRTAFRVAAGLLKDRRRRSVTFDDARLHDAVGRPADPSMAEFVSQLGALTEQQRAIIVLRYVGGFTPTEIAGLLHSTPGSVRVQLHRAHAHLREAQENADG